MSDIRSFREWQAAAVAAAEAGEPVPVIGGTVTVGSRVKHMNQRFGYADGTMTVEGFEVVRDNGPWARVLVKKERPGDSEFIKPQWDFDRTEVVADVPAPSSGVGGGVSASLSPENNAPESGV